MGGLEADMKVVDSEGKDDSVSPRSGLEEEKDDGDGDGPCSLPSCIPTVTNAADAAAVSSTRGTGVLVERKLIRGYIDGCFDLMHSGHFNAIRQAKQLCDVLVVGVHTDEVIRTCKAEPVILEEERYAILKHLKWIDEIVYDVPYTPDVETLERANADFCIHGDDMPTNENGECAYEPVRKAGKLKIIKRTEGVSTTDIIGRILRAGKSYNKDHHQSLGTGTAESSTSEINLLSDSGIQTLATVRRIAEFSGFRVPTKDDVVVYIDGDFDPFNVSHASLLEKAKELGTYLIVGIYDDAVCRKLYGPHSLLHNVCERVLSVCACRYVDDVIMASPYMISQDLLTTLNISYVVQGAHVKKLPRIVTAEEAETDNYALPKGLGIYKEVESDFSYLTKQCIIDRVLENKEAYMARNWKRSLMEQDYYKNKKSSHEIGIM